MRAFILLSAFFSLGSVPVGAEKIALFDGKTLDGWDGDARLWSVKDGVIHGETTAEKKANRNTFLIWKGGKLKDFELLGSPLMQIRS